MCIHGYTYIHYIYIYIYMYMCIYIYIYIYVDVFILPCGVLSCGLPLRILWVFPAGLSLRVLLCKTRELAKILPAEVRCYLFVKEVSPETPDVTPMSHLTADAVLFVNVLRETPDVTPCHTSPPQGVLLLVCISTLKHCKAIADVYSNIELTRMQHPCSERGGSQLLHLGPGALQPRKRTHGL